jgi:hypothetical protein
MVWKWWTKQYPGNSTQTRRMHGKKCRKRYRKKNGGMSGRRMQGGDPAKTRGRTPWLVMHDLQQGHNGREWAAATTVSGRERACVGVGKEKEMEAAQCSTVHLASSLVPPTQTLMITPPTHHPVVPTPRRPMRI